MKNLNPLFLIEALITPKQIRAIKSTHTDYHKLGQIAKKAMNEAEKAGYPGARTAKRIRRHSKTLDVPRFFKGIGEI